MHPDHSSELDYIMRGNPENKPRLYRKKEMVGEIGWKAGQSTSRPKDLSGNFHGFKRGEFRQAQQRLTILFMKIKSFCLSRISNLII